MTTIEKMADLMGNGETLAPNTGAIFNYYCAFGLISRRDEHTLAASEGLYLNRLNIKAVGDVGDRDRALLASKLFMYGQSQLCRVLPYLFNIEAIKAQCLSARDKGQG